MALQHLPRWLWGRKSRGRSSGKFSSSASSSAAGLPPSRTSSVSSQMSRDRFLTRKGSKKCQKRTDMEGDAVLVPSDGGCISGSESDDSDWSIGWFEPHPPDFSSENESEKSFAVLVPCYGLPPSRNPSQEIDPSVFLRAENPNHELSNAVLSQHSSASSSDDSKKYLEQWLSTLK
eukprot:TRINITY_DN15631_c0_g2_i1.p1 TRINITY_DN15631_c0_g2~~TRINITY_DN15631_c0_g2_i1.p1  ORF type:complete len:176 (-),score=49.78 TRINITY_DN15631_c0_g2_i1:458-985(-)